jgi:hypothetical protein
LQVNAEGVFRYAYIPWFAQALQVLALSGVHGVAVDVWVSDVTMVSKDACTASGLQEQQRSISSNGSRLSNNSEPDAAVAACLLVSNTQQGS